MYNINELTIIKMPETPIISPNYPQGVEYYKPAEEFDLSKENEDREKRKSERGAVWEKIDEYLTRHNLNTKSDIFISVDDEGGASLKVGEGGFLVIQSKEAIEEFPAEISSVSGQVSFINAEVNVELPSIKRVEGGLKIHAANVSLVALEYAKGLDIAADTVSFPVLTEAGFIDVYVTDTLTLPVLRKARVLRTGTKTVNVPELEIIGELYLRSGCTAFSAPNLKHITKEISVSSVKDLVLPAIEELTVSFGFEGQSLSLPNLKKCRALGLTVQQLDLPQLEEIIGIASLNVPELNLPALLRIYDDLMFDGVAADLPKIVYASIIVSHTAIRFSAPNLVETSGNLLLKVAEVVDLNSFRRTNSQLSSLEIGGSHVELPAFYEGGSINAPNATTFSAPHLHKLVGGLTLSKATHIFVPELETIAGVITVLRPKKLNLSARLRRLLKHHDDEYEEIIARDVEDKQALIAVLRAESELSLSRADVPDEDADKGVSKVE